MDGLLCWKLDRLARNPIDGGALIWALDTGQIQEIVTREKRFTNRGDEKFWMQLEFGMAKKYVDDLSDNVKRGNRAKLATGWLPGLAPLGYLNDKATKTIAPDPDRFELVSRLFQLVLAGRSPVDALTMANREWGLRRRGFHGRVGGPLSRSTFYEMLSNPFYYGLLVRNGESYPGKHRPMISSDEFDRIQELLGRPNRKHVKQYQFAFTGLIQCGECDFSVTAEEKVNRYGSHYVYYHCSKRRLDVQCGQPAIRREALEAQIVETLRAVHLDDEICDWAFAKLDRMRNEATQAERSIRDSLQAAYAKNRKQVDTLLQLRLQGLITDEEYAAKKQALVAEQMKLDQQRKNPEAAATRWLELSRHALILANQAPKRFVEGSLDEKREIVLGLGSNLVLKDRNLRFYLHEPFRLLAQQPRKTVWSAIPDGLRTFFMAHPDRIQWPAFCRETPLSKGKRKLKAA